MSNAYFELPIAYNEPVLSYAAGSPEKGKVKSEIAKLKGKEIDIPMYIGGKKVRTKNKIKIRPPHELDHVLGHFNKGDGKHVKDAIKAALKAKTAWENMPWQHRANIFLKAADLLSGPYRAKMNAATMLGQSKNIYQAEIDAVAELCDFFRFNVQYMTCLLYTSPSPRD